MSFVGLIREFYAGDGCGADGGFENSQLPIA
jgi:hypothetical protein